MRLLVFNAGSSSLKFDLMEVTGKGPARRLKAGAFVDLADGSGRFELQSAEPAPPRSAPIRTLADWLAQWFSFPWTPARRGAWVALAACLALVVGLGAWNFGPTVGEPVLAEFQGTGLSLERASQILPAVAGTRLQSGDVLRTPENVTAVISFVPENTRILIEPGTDLKVTGLSHGKRFALGVGKLEASVARQRPWKPMVLVTAQAKARVLGTQFTLAATTNATRLEVTEGKVKLTRKSDGSVVQAAAGHYAVAATNFVLAAQPLPGKVLREFWLDLPGDTLQDMTYHARYPNSPSGHDFPPSFETNTNWPSAFGTRTRAYLLPSVTGDYEFRISGNGQICLWLSPDDDPVNRVKVAQIVFTRNRPGDEGPETTTSRQESGPIPLEAGRRYYIEAAHKYGNGQDRLTVTWKRPEGAEEPIPAEFLAPFVLEKHGGKK